MKPSEILKCAVTHIAKKGGWTQHAYARDRTREACPETAGVSFCSLGAIRRCAFYDDTAQDGREWQRYNECEHYLESLAEVGGDVISWNDADNRRKPQVIRAFQKAIAAAEAAEAEGAA